MHWETNRFVSALLVGIFVTLAGGCQSPATESPATDASPAAEPAAAEPSEADKIATAMAGLSDADRELALAQKICPVSEEPLGTMGVPPKVNVNGRDVFICCEGCREFLVGEDSAKYLSNLEKK